MAELEMLRQKIFEESKFDPENRKFGLFSFPGTLAVAKHSYFQMRKSRRNKDGTVDAGLRNFITTSPKKGKLKDALFSYPEESAEEFKERTTYFQEERKRVKKEKDVHGEVWKPAGKAKEEIYPFEFISPEPEKPNQKKLKTTELGPKNFLTSPMKKGHASVTPGVTFGQYPEHMADPYNLKFSKANLTKGIKIANHDSPFKSTDFGLRSFSKDMEIYGSDSKIRPKKRQVSYSHSFAKHDLPFKSTTRGVDCFEKHPEYMPSPLPIIKRRKPDESTPWKVSPSSRSTPTPSISFKACNLRSEFASLRY